VGKRTFILIQSIFIKEYFLFTVGSVLPREGVHRWVEEFSRGHSKVTNDAGPGHPVQIVKEVTLQLVEELI
jgi:hypothetical protein